MQLFISEIKRKRFIVPWKLVRYPGRGRWRSGEKGRETSETSKHFDNFVTYQASDLQPLLQNKASIWWLHSPPFLRTFTRLTTAGTSARVFIILTSLPVALYLPPGRMPADNPTIKPRGKADSWNSRRATFRVVESKPPSMTNQGACGEIYHRQQQQWRWNCENGYPSRFQRFLQLYSK